MCVGKLVVILVLGQLDSLIGEPIVQLPNGQILGQPATTAGNKTYYRFEGIPFAAPPVGPLRFKAPQPPQNWDGIRNSTFLETTCFQTSANTDNESEDCLYINVYTPQLPDSDNFELLPVLFHIYGGGFTDGSFQVYNPDLFINNDVIFVTHNYRVGIFGFISTQDEVIPGNNGLKDQQFALRWTHDNIHLFGGDPNKTTIIGQSAGSASCAYQLLNRDNNGLFQAAILESGTILSPWAFQRNSREIAFAVAAFIDPTFADSDDSQSLLDFLQKVDAKEIDAAAEDYRMTHTGPEYIEISQGFFYAPVIEAKNPDAFLTRKMYGLLNAENIISVPIIIGMTSEESLYFNQDESVLQSNMKAYDEHVEWLVPNDMEIENETQRTDIGLRIKELYTKGEPLADHLGDGIRYSSDNSFTRSIIKFADIYSKLSKTYFYQFSYSGNLGLGTPLPFNDTGKVGHGDDVGYLFCVTKCDDSISESDLITRNRLLKLFTDFAKHQNPTPVLSDLLQNVSWPLLSTEDGDFYYLDIDENLEIRNHPREEAYKGWTELYESLHFQDFDTY